MMLRFFRAAQSLAVKPASLNIARVSSPYLAGNLSSVDTPPNSDRAGKLAAAVAGVKEVDNKLVPMSTR